MEEECGVFGVTGSGIEASNFTYFGLHALQHRGQESAGIASFDINNLILHKNMGLVNQIFSPEILKKLKGDLAIGHTRYSTTGDSHIKNAQPHVSNSIKGSFAIAHNGNLVNSKHLKSLLNDYPATSDSELISKLIETYASKCQTWEDTIISSLNHCEGSFSIVIATSSGLFAVRDGNGVRPLVYGKAPCGTWTISSETCGLEIIGAKYIDDIKPGELIKFNYGEEPEKIQWCNKDHKHCIFEMIYFARPDSRYYQESIYTYRQRIGRVLSKESPVDADIVVGVPDSGIAPAIGYSQESGIPFAEGIIKNRYIGRTFIQPSHEMRENDIKMKLNPMPDVLKGKRIILIDDSIVRGNTSRKLVKALREAGVIEIHMRITSPPVTHPCFYGIDTDTKDQLIAANNTIEEIRQHLGVETLSYLSKYGMLNSANTNNDNFCTACFDGEYPIPITSSLKGN